MSYELEAYLVPLAALEGSRPHEVPRVFYRLTDELALVPLVWGGELPDTWPVGASESTTIARVSAGYFGGYGGQKATVWRDGEVVAEGVEVNEALRRLGVERSGGDDEWDTIGLGRFRRTETWAAEAIRQDRNRDGLSLEGLLEVLEYESPNAKLQDKVRAGAIRDLAELGDERAIPHLAAIVGSGAKGLVISAASALARIGGAGLAELAQVLRDAERTPDLGQRLMRLVKRPEPFDYFPIVHALGEAGPAAGDYAAEVSALLWHDDFRARSVAAQALAQMGRAAEVAVPALTHMLGDEESFNRSYAAQALGAIGPAARPAREQLQALLDDEAHTVRDSARAALAAIDGGTGPD